MYIDKQCSIHLNHRTNAVATRCQIHHQALYNNSPVPCHDKLDNSTSIRGKFHLTTNFFQNLALYYRYTHESSKGIQHFPTNLCMPLNTNIYP